MFDFSLAKILKCSTACANLTLAWSKLTTHSSAMNLCGHVNVFTNDHSFAVFYQNARNSGRLNSFGFWAQYDRVDIVYCRLLEEVS